MSEKKTTTANALEPLAERINAGHKKCLLSLRSSLKHARETGTLLLEAKEKVAAAGEPWRPWVQDHCECSLSEASRYLRIANRYHELLQSGADLGKLTVTQALKLLAPSQKVAHQLLPPIKVPSRAEVKELAHKAGEVRLPDDSAEKKFVAATVAGIVQQILARAAASKLTDWQQQPLSAAEIALALLAQLKKALTVETVVEAEEAVQPRKPAGPESSPAPSSPDAPRNRLNGGGHKKNSAAAAV